MSRIFPRMVEISSANEVLERNSQARQDQVWLSDIMSSHPKTTGFQTETNSRKGWI